MHAYMGETGQRPLLVVPDEYFAWQWQAGATRAPFISFLAPDITHTVYVTLVIWLPEWQLASFFETL